MSKKSNLRSVKTPTPKNRQSITPEQLIAEINNRAYYFSIERGNGQGTPLEDWLAAEKEIKARYGIA